jgi:hypothetical protein
MVIGTYKMTLPSNRHSVQFTGAGRPSQALSKTNSGYSGTAEKELKNEGNRQLPQHE